MPESYWTASTRWRPVALVISGGLCLASLISFIVNFDHIEHWTQFFAVATIVSATGFTMLGRVSNRRRERR